MGYTHKLINIIYYAIQDIQTLHKFRTTNLNLEQNYPILMHSGYVEIYFYYFNP